jgi:hypothetical protein
MEQTAHAVGDPVMDNEGLTPDELAAFLDGKLEGEELERVQGYLADNPQARQELIKASRIATSAPALTTIRQRPRWLYPAAALAAAAALMISLRPQSRAPSERTSTERRPAIEEAERVVLLSPANGQRIAQDAPFAWHAYGNATYQFVLKDDSGTRLFEKTTQDTVLSLDPSIAAKAKGKLYWTVDAFGENGSVISSAEGEFELVPLK